MPSLFLGPKRGTRQLISKLVIRFPDTLFLYGIRARRVQNRDADAKISWIKGL